MMTSTIRYMLYAVHHLVIPARVIKEDLMLAFVGYSEVNTHLPRGDLQYCMAKAVKATAFLHRVVDRHHFCIEPRSG